MARKHAVMDTISRPSVRIYNKRHTRKIPLLAFGALFVLSAAVSITLLVRGAQYHTAREEYAAIQTAFEGGNETEGHMPELEETPMIAAVPVSARSPTATPIPGPHDSARVADLRKENRDTVGWLDILETEMRYPIVQGRDNDYYMTHTFQKKRNASGAIFLDCWNMPDFTDFNTVMYGHNMKDGSMFAGLREYRHQGFADEHPYVEITLTNKKLRYRVFAAYISQGEDSADFRGQDCTTQEQRSAFIKAARKRSTELASGFTVSRYDRLLTLVTCTAGDHPWFWIVHAVLVGEEE